MDTSDHDSVYPTPHSSADGVFRTDRVEQQPQPRRKAPSPNPSCAPPSPKRHKMAYSGTTDADADRPLCQWHANKIPVEIFEIIIAYLPRAEIKTLRQVCREFNYKVSAQYFKNVVVPFRSELYGDLLRDENGDIQQHPVSLLSNAGNRIFESFGSHIHRFALSLEIDEDGLAHPPLKPAQEAIPSFWGIYRWPHKTYNRYADLESIEETADETQGMKDVLRHLTKIRNLGLCCDAGLGFLIRPDTVARGTVVKQPVFATHDWRRESRARNATQNDETVITLADFNGNRSLRRKDSNDSLDHKQSVLEKMATEAGYKGDQIQEAIHLLLETEGQPVDQITFEGGPNPAEQPSEAESSDTETETAALFRQRQNLGRLRPVPGAPTPENARQPPALIPNNLSKAQREVILELEWAHRAMIQSFVIATIDNASAGCFNNVTTLTIAKIPSSHVHILYHEAFWSSLPQLNTVHLGVIADWRKITKGIPGCIEDTHISPVQAVSTVYTLLNDFIGKQPNIESLHFEWICGGEFAPSFAQRNRYILPVPVQGRSVMVFPVGTDNPLSGLLELPYVKHFSLKNCWATPHVFWQVVRQMGLASLEKLQLESVSLSACYTADPQLGLAHAQPGAGAAAHQNYIQQMAAANFAPQPGPVAAPNPAWPFAIPGATHQGGWVQPPPAPGGPSSNTNDTTEWHSWTGFLEHFSPGRNVRRMRANDDSYAYSSTWQAELDKAGYFMPDAQHLLAEENRYKIKCISLKSCGRVAVDNAHIASRSLTAAARAFGPHSATEAQTNLSKYMQQDWDPMLGRVISAADPQEMWCLTEMFGLVHGWHGVYREEVIANAREDGITLPGLGRFSGVLEKNGTRTEFDVDQGLMESSRPSASNSTLAYPTIPNAADEGENDWGDDDW